MSGPLARLARRLPFFYGWVVVAVAFVALAIVVTARTSFSLLMPPLIDEFAWDRGVAAGAFSFGFLLSAVFSPFIGRTMDRRGPRVVVGAGVVLVGGGMLLAPFVATPWQLYATLGAMVGCGSNFATYTAHSQFLPRWFVRRRGLAISIAFAGAGAGAIVILPWLQAIIGREGWRAACTTMGVLVLAGVLPLVFLLRRQPEDLALRPDGDAAPAAGAPPRATNVVDAAWAGTAWTLRRALGTARFWWIALGFFLAMVAWYVVQVHQTKYLVEIGFSPRVAAWALGAVVVVAIPGQIILGALSDRIGREWVWSLACGGFALCYAALIALEAGPSPLLLYAMVATQGFLGYAATSVMGAIVAEIFEGPNFGAIFGAITVALILGGAFGPWMAGLVHDATGSYRLAFALALGGCLVSAAAIWLAAPRKVRRVAGRRRHAD